MQARAAATGELDYLARLWYDGWQDAHARILPAELARYRTLDSFRQRLDAAIATVRVAGPSGSPLGFCMVREDEFYQLYVAAAARGTTMASTLLGDGETRLAADGVLTAWLACAIGNERAARFYAKHGWRRTGIVTSQRETPDGPFPLDVWRYEKDLR
jgi:ribosomal protein S18 acetylase RimI-like enzyme